MHPSGPAQDPLADLQSLLKSHYPIIVLETEEEERAAALLKYLADRLGLPFFSWSPTKGLRRDGQAAKVYGTTDPALALDHLETTDLPGVYLFKELGAYLDKPAVREKLKDVAARFSKHPGAVVLVGLSEALPPGLDGQAARVSLGLPSARDYDALLRRVVRDVSGRMSVEAALTREDLRRLVGNLRGLTLTEAEKVLTKAIVMDRRLCRKDIEEVLSAKKKVLERDGLLEYYPHEDAAAEIAGLRRLKDWLRKRKALLAHPEKAAEFGLEFPKGVLLLGVQGCGKSLCAKAVAREWGLPLIKLDPSRLYNKYVGESEANLRKAMRAAEAMAPAVLWIDEIEKALASSPDGDGDGGLSRRVLGTLLGWLQDRKAPVFIVATANDVESLPPELLRKGRFDEIFFVDLPDAAARREILAIHLRRRNLKPEAFDLAALAAASEGFSGAELEQAVVSALYAAFPDRARLGTAAVAEELRRTVPLSRAMREKIDRLRAWAKDRAVSAD